MYEYGTLKHVEVILKRGLDRREIVEGMNQLGYMFMWKCHSETPCIPIIY
jgi:predicted DNA-binding transcriptional regulator